MDLCKKRRFPPAESVVLQRTFAVLYKDSQLPQHFPDGVCDDQPGGQVPGHGGFVDEHQLVAPVVVDESGGGVDVEGGAADDEQVRLCDGPDGIVQGLLIQPLLIQHHVGLNDAAALAPGDAAAVKHEVKVMELAALFAVVPVDAAVELQHPAAPGGLVEPVDVLGDDGLQLSGLFPLRQLVVSGVGLGVGGQQLGPVEAEKFFGVAFVERMA